MDAIVEFFSQMPPLGWAGIVTWLLIAFGNSKERDDFMEKSYKIITAPSQLQEYPEQTLKDIEQKFELALITPAKNLIVWLVGAGKTIWDKYQWKLIGQFVMFAFLPFFFLADAIAISSVLDTLGLPVEKLPENILDLLGQYGIAVAAGTFFSVVVSAFVMFEIFGSSEFSDYGNYPEPLKKIVKAIAIFVMASSLISGIAFGFQAWKAQGSLPTWLNTDGFVLFSMNVLVRANVLIATGVILLEAFKGLLTILLIIIGIVLVITGIIFTILSVIGSLGRIIIDWIIRLFRWVLWLISFLVFAPLDIIKSAPKDFITFMASLFKKQ